MQNWMNKLQRKFGKYAIHNLMYYIIILYAFGTALTLLNPGFYESWLCLDAEAILHGQIWRIATFLLQPPPGSLLFVILALYLYYMIGTNLEREWGAFRFNLYFFMGVLFHVLAALIIYLITGVSYSLGTYYLNMSLFFAFAMVYPDMEFMLFFLIPIKVKWLAIADGIYFAVTILAGFLGPVLPMATRLGLYRFGVASDLASSIAALLSLMNFIIFYLSSRNYQRISPKEVKRKKKYKSAVKKAQKVRVYEGGARHKCAVCGRTELDDENLEFRFCSKCNGEYEYCQDHLFTHTHKKSKTPL